MTRRVSFHPMAEQELNDAAGYYNAQSPGLGHAFLDEMQHAVGQILDRKEEMSGTVSPEGRGQGGQPASTELAANHGLTMPCS